MQKLFLLFALMLIVNSLHAQNLGTKIRDTIVIKEKFDYLCASRTGEIIAVVVNPDGSTTEEVVDFYKTPSQSLITDGNGDSLVITKDNKIMGLSEFKATGGNKALLNDYHRKKDSAAVWYVNFDKADDQKFLHL